MLSSQLADEHLELKARCGLRSLDCEIRGGCELNTTRNLGSGAALQSRDVRVAFEWRQRDVAKHFLTTAARKQMFTKSEPVIVACDQTDQHHWLSAIFEQSMQCFQCPLAIARHQMIGQLKI